MKKIFTLATMLLLAVGAWAAEQTFTMTADYATTTTVGNFTFTADKGSGSTSPTFNTNSNDLRIYANGTFTITTTGDAMTKVVFNLSNKGKQRLAAITTTSGSIATQATGDSTVTWTGSASNVVFTVGSSAEYGSDGATKAGQFDFTSITITTDGTGGGTTTSDTTLVVDSISTLRDMADGITFKMGKPVYVNYQYQNYLWIAQIDDEGYMYAHVVYGDVGQTYNVGDIIPAGWTATTATYRTLPELKNPAGFQAATGQYGEEYTSPIENTDYIGYPDIYYDANFKLAYSAVELDSINGKNFVVKSTQLAYDDNWNLDTMVYTLKCYNKFGIEMPTTTEGRTFDVWGMMSARDGELELWPLEITETSYRLWKVLYYGEEDTYYNIGDTLYIAAASDPDHLIYVTDNATTILNDTWAAFGYVYYMEWMPDWIALDFSNNVQAYEKMKGAIGMMIMPGTMGGTFKEPLNPRLVVDNEVATTTADMDPIIAAHDMAGDMHVMGNEVIQVEGYYNYYGRPVFRGYSNQASHQGQMIDLNPLYCEVTNWTVGVKYSTLAVCRLLEPWEADDEEDVSDENLTIATAPAQLPSKPVVAQRDGRPIKVKASQVPAAPKRMQLSDPYYYRNVVLYPLQGTPTGIAEVNTTRNIDTVTYVNALGQQQATPFEGFNIVVTRYNDGTTSTTRVLH